MLDILAVVTARKTNIRFVTRGALDVAVSEFTSPKDCRMADARTQRQRRISLVLRKQIDLGLSAFVASMPEFTAFQDDREKRFFRIQSITLAGMAAFTYFDGARPPKIRSRKEKERAA